MWYRRYSHNQFKLQKKIFRPDWKQVDFNKTLFWLQKSRLSFSGSVRYDRHSRDQMWPSRKISTDPITAFGFHVIRLKVWPLQPVRLALQTSLHPAGRLTAALMSECCLRASPFRVDGGRSECRREQFLNWRLSPCRWTSNDHPPPCWLFYRRIDRLLWELLSSPS